MKFKFRVHKYRTEYLAHDLVVEVEADDPTEGRHLASEIANETDIPDESWEVVNADEDITDIELVEEPQ